MTSNDHGTTTEGAAQVFNPAEQQFDGLSNYAEQDMREAFVDILLNRIRTTPYYHQNWIDYDSLDDDDWAIVSRGVDPYIVAMAEMFDDVRCRKLVEAQVYLMWQSIKLRRYWQDEVGNADHMASLRCQQG